MKNNARIAKDGTFKKWLPFIFLFVIILIGAFLRLYRIGDYLEFLGDQGRDALIVKHIIVDHKFTLLGPITSVGLMHLGPMYYYFMVPFLWLWQLDPSGPAVMVALFSLATIVLIWHICRHYFNLRAAFIASTLYALSPLVITYSHTSWNPNILPFWALAIIYGLIKVIAEKKYVYLVLIGVSIAVAIQLHYIALIFIPFTILSLILFKSRIPLKYYVWGALGFIALYSPYVLFELRHEFINTKTVLEFITRGGTGHSTFALSNFFFKFWDLSVRLFWRLVVIKNAELSITFMLFVLGVSLYYVFNEQNVVRRKILVLLGLWYLVGVSLLSLYTGSTYDYYLMFAFPFPFIASGIALSTLFKSKITTVICLLIVIAIAFFQVQSTPILKEPNRLAAQAKEIADFVLTQAAHKPYNFALLAPNNSDHAYRYFLETGGNTPVAIENTGIDPERHTVTDQLLIVCEEKVCQPLGHPLWEVAGFGRAEIAGQWNVGLFKVYKLLHYRGE